MDISVSRLNNRMALQVPGELPLGLVFVVGRVKSLGEPDEGMVRFELVDGGYHLRCHLPAAVAEETLLKEKDRVRASGQLTFDSRSAQYRLLARDIEVLAAHPPSEKPAKADATAVQAESNAASLVPTELPPWVQKLAPPEIKEELDLEGKEEIDEGAADADVVEEERQVARDRTEELPPEMVAFLSNAIDSDEEIELTPEMIAEYLPKMRERREGKAAEEGALAAEELASMAAREPHEEREESADAEQAIVDGGPADESASAVSDQVAEPVEGSTESLEETTVPEKTRPRVLSPPQGAPRRDGQPEPEPGARRTRDYIEYAIIVLLVFLIMAALITAVVLLQT